MNKLLRIILISIIFSLILGPTGQIPQFIPQVNIYLTDILVGFLVIICLLRLRLFIRIFRSDAIVKYFFIFIIVAFLSFLFTPIRLTSIQMFVCVLYLVRFLSYFFIYPAAVYLIKQNELTRNDLLTKLILTGLILSILGWIQYFVYPDLRNLEYLGWDPHFKRIFSTYFDPNYLGLILVLSFIGLLFINLPKPISLMAQIFILITLAFTYSRGSYLAFLSGIFYFSYIKRKIFTAAILFIAFLSIVLMLPRNLGEGVNLLRLYSIEDRIGSLQDGWKIFVNHPLIGVGFNTARFAKRQFNVGGSDLSVSHSGAGFENSLLFVAVTTGIIGLSFYLMTLRKLWQQGDALVKTCFAAIIVHSLFVNSLFFPFILVWFWVIGANLYSRKNPV